MGKRHEYVVETREPEHPIMKGIPSKWLHTVDELYDRLRGPCKNVTVLASSFSDAETGGTGEDEPILMDIRYGKGRIFHTVLGHDLISMASVGFQLTLERGCEWAATGNVTIPVPDRFASENQSLSRNPKTGEYVEGKANEKAEDKGKHAPKSPR